MSSADNFISITGNLTRDPELKFLASGSPVVNFMIAQTPRQFNRNTNEWKDLEPNFFRVSAFGDIANNAAETLTKGSRVTVLGEFRTERYVQEGVEKTSNNIKAEEISASLRYASGALTRNPRKEGGNGGGNGFAQYANNNTAASNDDSGDAPF